MIKRNGRSTAENASKLQSHTNICLLGLSNKMSSDPSQEAAKKDAKGSSLLKDCLQKLAGAVAEKIAGMMADKVSSLWNVEEDTKKLRRIESRIHALLTDAEQRRIVEDDSIKLWLQELRAVAFDVDTLLDRLNTITADPSRKRKWPINLDPWQWQPLKLADIINTIKLNRLNTIKLDPRRWSRWELADTITDINERLDEISKNRKKFRFQDGDAMKKAAQQQAEQCKRFLQAAACCDERPIGRMQEKDKIIAALVSSTGGGSSSSNPEVPVISIRGTPGIGKTALARLVFNDPKVKAFFPANAMVWVWLPPDVCDASRAMKVIIQAVTGKKCEFSSLDILQEQLRSLLSQKMFLLVIDNLWAQSFQFWESLRPSLMSGTKGSKVLITTRNKTVSRMVSNIILDIHLKGLTQDECWQILQVFGFSESISEEQKKDLKPIGNKIANNCQGSPLAAKSFGVLLCDADGQKEQWEYISEMQILEDDKNINNIVLASLQISYDHLPYHLKRCFAFCSVLPAGLEFEKDEVVRLWIAEGLIESNGKRPEMEAGNYFHKLLSASFFEASSIHSDQKKYRVPSLMLDLARYVSKYESLTVHPHNESPLPDNGHPDWIRYATILPTKDEPLAFGTIKHYTSLRFLKLCPRMKLPSNQIPSRLSSELTCLRTLDLSYTKIGILPASVGCLMHLRYLGLRGTLIVTLPKEVCNLFNLQTLDLTDCYELKDLPAGMSRLIHMRHLCLHLDWDRVDTFRSMPSGIDKLESLQTLSRFVVVPPSDGAGKCNIGELKNLKIRGELCILKLEGTTSSGAIKANLGAKEYLDKLMLKWSAGTSTDERQIEESENVLKALCPHRNLKHLCIKNYPGKRLPKWVRMISHVDKVSCPNLAKLEEDLYA